MTGIACMCKPSNIAYRPDLRSCWALRLPDGMSSKQAAGVGTAGYTAMLCIQAMENIGLHPSQGPVLVTGATGNIRNYHA